MEDSSSESPQRKPIKNDAKRVDKKKVEMSNSDDSDNSNDEITFNKKISFIPKIEKKIDIEPKVVEAKSPEKLQGDKLIFIDKNYTVKPDDSIIVITASSPLKIQLFSISGSKNNIHMSKKIIIKSLVGLTTHTIECAAGNTINDDNNKLILVGLDSIQLQTAGKMWITV